MHGTPTPPTCNVFHDHELTNDFSFSRYGATPLLHFSLHLNSYNASLPEVFQVTFAMLFVAGLRAPIHQQQSSSLYPRCGAQSAEPRTPSADAAAAPAGICLPGLSPGGTQSSCMDRRRLKPAPHGCVSHALRCDPSRCVHVYTICMDVSRRIATQRMKNASVWDGSQSPTRHNSPRSLACTVLRDDLVIT